MIDLRFLRENADRVRDGARLKHFPDRAEAVDRALAVDEELRGMLPQLEDLRAEQKKAAKEIGRLPPEQREGRLAEQRKLKEQLQGLEESEKDLRSRLDHELMQLPQVPDAEVPAGKDDSFNVEVRKVGTPRDFAAEGFEPRSHDELAMAQGWLDTERAATLSGSRNYMLFGDLALLHDAVLRYALEHMVDKGFVAVDPPLLVRDEVMQGTGFFPGGEEQTYRVPSDGLNLIGTSEVPVTAICGDRILDEADLPKRFVARSVCFRREAGTYGKDTKGLYRVHQFQKVEQVVVDVADEARSREHHEAIVKNAEEVLEAFGLAWRVVVVCGGDLGVGQAFKYDIETWMPSRGAYGETHSASRFYDFQARRLGMRYRSASSKKPQYCHTLNNTVLASPRVLIALLETHQQADGTIRLPEALRPYMRGREVLGKPLT